MHDSLFTGKISHQLYLLRRLYILIGSKMVRYWSDPLPVKNFFSIPIFLNSLIATGCSYVVSQGHIYARIDQLTGKNFFLPAARARIFSAIV